MEMVNSFKRYLKAIVPHIVYKSVRDAEKYETPESRFSGDEYIGAVLKTDDWLVVRPETLTVEILNAAGIYDKDLIDQIWTNTYLVPLEKRTKVLELRRKAIIDSYEEKNNYYRMLAGLPDVDAEFIYPDPNELIAFGFTGNSVEDYESDNLENMTPLHRLPQTILNAMDDSGYLKEIYDNYINDTGYNAEYVKYLGRRRIPIEQARMADHFELLYVPRPDNANRFNRDFVMYYEEARHYMLGQVYNFHYSASFPYYESYIGFFILVMAIQRMVDSMFEVMVDRDFYDLETCRMFLEAYGVPFVDMFTFRQQKTLVKNLNILIMNKCTSQVMYDILGLLEYDDYDLTKYLLVKQHKTVQMNAESEPVPIFIYRTVLDEDGNATYELDKTKSYEYYFVGVPMNETDINLVEQTDANAHSYESVTVPDSLWIEDRELVERLQDAEINYTETKYTNVAITIRMQEMMFEHVYLQKMLCDKANETSNIMVDLSLINNSKVSLFELEIMLICILCRYYNMEPDLLTSPSKTLAVLGFNFDEDLEAIKDEIRNNPDLYSPKLLKYIDNIYFRTASNVNEMYRNVKELSRLLIEVMQLTQDERVYHANKKLYNTLLITDVHNEVFNLPDGSTPDTYMDWLKAYDYPIYEYIDALDRDSCVDKINYIATKMSTLFADTEYLQYLNPIDTTVINGIIRILRWFKSYTIEIKEMEVVYLFDSKYYNLMKMMSRIWLHAVLCVRELDIGYHEWIQAMSAAMKVKETRNKLFEILRMSGHMSMSELNNRFKDAFKLIGKLTLRDLMIGAYGDTIVYLEGTGFMGLDEDGSFIETVDMEGNGIIRDNLDKDGNLVMHEGINNMDASAKIYDTMSPYYADTMSVGTKHAKFVENKPLKEVINSTSATTHIQETNNKLDDKNRVRFLDTKGVIRETIFSNYSDVIMFRADTESLTGNRSFLSSIESAHGDMVIKDNSHIMKDKCIILGDGTIVDRRSAIEWYVDALLSHCDMTIKEKMAMTDTRRPLQFIVHDE